MSPTHRNAILGVVSSTTANTANTSNTAETSYRNQSSRLSSHTEVEIAPKLEPSQLLPSVSKPKGKYLKHHLVSFRPVSVQPVGLLTKRKLLLQTSLGESYQRETWSGRVGIKRESGKGERKQRTVSGGARLYKERIGGHAKLVSN